MYRTGASKDMKQRQTHIDRAWQLYRTLELKTSILKHCVLTLEIFGVAILINQ